MAARQTSDIFVRLNLENIEGIDKLKSAFRDLDKTVGVSSSTIDVAKRRLDEYVRGMDRSEQVIKGQLSALQGLRAQVDVNGATYRKFTTEIGKLEAELGSLTGGITKNAQALTQGLVPTDAALSRLRDGILATGAASKQTEKSLGQQIQQLQSLRSQAALNGDVYRTLTADITRLTVTVKDASSSANAWATSQNVMAKAGKFATSAIADEIKNLASLSTQLDSLKAKATSFALSGSVAAGGPGGVTGAIQSIVGLRQQLARSMPGRVVLAGEGIAATGLAGAAGTGAAAGIGGIAAGLQASSGQLDAFIAKAQELPAILRPLGNLLTGPAAEAAASIDQWSAQLSATQAKLAALAAPFDAIGTAVASIGPEASAAAGVASVAIASVYSILSRQADKTRAEAEAAFKGIGDDAQRALQQLVKLYDQIPSARLAAQEQLRTTNLTRLEDALPGSIEARRAANAVAVAEREISKIKAEQNKLLDAARAKQSVNTLEIKQQIGVAKARLDVQRRLTQSVLAEQQAYKQSRAVQRSIQRYRADIPLEAQTTTALSDELNRLGRSIANTRRDTEEYITLQVELANVQRVATAATQGLGQALLGDLQTGQAVSSQRNLQEVIATLKNEMSQLDTTTTQGFDQYTRYASDVRNLEEQIARLGRAYSTAAAGAQQLSDTTENAVLNRMVNEASTGRLARQQRARAEGMQELRQAITTGVQGTPLLLPAAGQTSAPGTGQARSGGARPLRSLRTQIPYAPEPGQVEYTFGFSPELRNRATQAFFNRPTQEVEYGQAAAGFTRETAAAARTASSAGFAYRDLAKDIRLAQAAGGESLRTLEAQRAAWTRLQNAVDIGSNKYRLAAKRIEELDQRMGRGGPRRLSGFQMAQIGGAALSGGIFGGPEGLVGGVIGGAFGGVGGAFAGAAAGAQVGMLRQQLGQTSAYAAEIGKLQIALRGVSGSQANYTQAISAAAAVTKELNVPQREATAGITRLSAAVLGAGGQMSDATFAFRAISESIKATGGNAEQVDGALLALTQVFSKGKVSAEELNQIAERLPGTFTLFAKATGKSGPELQKALQQGQVGLNDLMKFLELASSKHGQTALKIAASNEEAGARMTVAFQKMALEVGNALKPIGAQIQTAFTKFATDITPQVVDASKGIGGLLKTIVDNGAAVGAVAKLAVQFGIATFALQAFAALKGPVTVALQAIALQFGAVNAQTVAAEARLKAFAATAKATAASLVAPIVLTIAIVGADLVMQRLAEIDEAQKNIGKIRRDISAPEWLKRAGGTALTKQDLTKLASDVASELDKANQTLRPLMESYFDIQKSLYGRVVETNTEAIRKDLETVRAKGPLEASIGGKAFAAQMLEAMDRVDQLNARYQEVIKALPSASTQRRTAGGGFPDPTGTGDDAKAKRDKATSDAQRTAETLAQQEIRLANAVFQHKQDLERQRYELAKELLDLETKNRLDQMGAVEREAAQALQQRQARETQFAERMRALNERIAKAQQDLASAQRMAAVTGGSRAGAAGLPAGISSYITGDTRSPYYRADHGGKNYHEHLRFVSRQAAEAAYDLLVKAGIKVTEFKGRTPVGRHTPGSAHYEGLAFDVPASQVPVGQERRLTALVQQTLGIGGGAAAAQQRRGIVDTGDVALAQVELQALRTAYNELIESKGRWDAAADTESISALTKAFSDQNQELQNTLRTDTLRAELQSKGYTAAQIDLEMKLADALDRRNRTLSEIPLVLSSAPDAIEAVNAKYLTQVDLLTKIYDLNQANANSFGFREGAQRYVESIGTMREATASLTEQGFRGLEDVIFQLTTTGAANFQAFAASILQQTARMIIQQLVLKTIMQAIGAIGGGGGADRSFDTLMAGINKYSANGNVFAANGIVPYAMGGIVNRPTLFPFANGGSIGTGLMGEAGPEAIIPLQRGANGKLGVAGGGGTTNVVVNVDASGGTAVSGDAGQAKQLGQAITAAVQAELIKQRRPGGLLAA